MRYEGTFAVRAPPDLVFAFLMNPRELSTCIDDPHTLDILDADRFRGTLRSGIGAIKGTFTWSATIAERVPDRRARLKVHGSGMGSAFDIDATIDIVEAGGSTAVAWGAEVVVSGKLASLGARLLQSAIEKKTKTIFDNARKRLESARI